MERFDLSELVPGTEARGATCIRSREERRTRGGKPYLIVELGNATGRSTARIWSEDLPAWDGIAPGDAVAIRARVKAGWRGGAPELEILSVEPLPDDHPVRLELNPHAPVAREALEERFDGLADSIQRSEARRLLHLVIERVRRDRYFGAPAAVSHHHAYIGGLAEHSIEVTELALALAATDPYAGLVDRDAIVVGGLLHDIGKVDEYEWEGVPIRISRAGRLRSHISRGAEIVAQAVMDAWAIEAGTVSELDLHHVQHVIESHHGQAEWGSPSPPRTLEAAIIHHADLASARLRPIADDLASAPADADHWLEPTGWRRGPVWAFGAAIAQECADQPADEPERTDLEPLPWEVADDEATERTTRAASLNGGDDA
jgi:3'-5' exoribonuclease